LPSVSGTRSANGQARSVFAVLLSLTVLVGGGWFV